MDLSHLDAVIFSWFCLNDWSIEVFGFREFAGKKSKESRHGLALSRTFQEAEDMR